jgi:hypothetical protein
MTDDLAALQRRFFRLVRAPTGVADEIPALGRDDPAGVPLLGWVRAPDEAGAAKRLDVYAEMYFYRLLDVLRGDYARLVRAVGDVAMHNLATDYLLAHPSDDPSLRHLGRHFPAFLRGHPLAAERPWLSDLAALEWARVEAFDTADDAVLAREAVAAMPTEAWPAHQFVLVRSARMIRLDWPVHEAWDALEAGADAPAIEVQATALLVWRTGWKVVHRPADAGEAAALGALFGGASFAGVCEAVARKAGELDVAARVVRMLLRWIDEDLLRA